MIAFVFQRLCSCVCNVQVLLCTLDVIINITSALLSLCSTAGLTIKSSIGTQKDSIAMLKHNTITVTKGPMWPWVHACMHQLLDQLVHDDCVA